jgi:Ni,Fe-hydrogenase III large subunit
MNNLKTVITIELPHDAHLVKTKLESEGIQAFLKDELTVQVDNYTSNAIGGIQLQVLEKDIDNAKSILKELGYITHKSRQENTQTPFLAGLTSRIPIIGKLAYELRILILLACLLYTSPSPRDRQKSRMPSSA